MVQYRKKGGEKMPVTYKRVLCLCLAVLFLPLCAGCGKRQADLRVCVMDVGQSDCILLSVQGQHMLIDTGTAAQREAVIATLAEQGIKHLDYLLITHPHEDHYGNARSVLETYTVGRLLLPAIAVEDAAYALVTEAAERRGVPVQTVVKGDSLSANIAAASILAKVTRDCMMEQLAEKYPGYGFEIHKGYGTKAHYDALRTYGPSSIHRMTFLRKFYGEK